MLTLRFESHDESYYRVYSCESYIVMIDDIEPEIKVVMVDKAGEEEHEYIGEAKSYHTAFVMNDAGKTIDVIRFKNVGGNLTVKEDRVASHSN